MTRENEEAAVALEKLLEREGELMYFDNYYYIEAIKTAIIALRKATA